VTVRIAIQVTTRCNMDCVHCLVRRSGRDLAIETFERICSFARTSGVSYLDLTGGEPTVHPRIADMLAMAGEAGLRVRIVTNGWDFVAFARRVRPHLGTVASMTFSLDAPSAEAHDAGRAPGSFNRLLQAFSVCRALHIPFDVRMAATSRSVGLLEAMALLSAKVGARSLTVLPLQPTPAAAGQDLLLTPRDLRRIPEEIARLRSIFKLDIVPSVGTFDDDPMALCPPLTANQFFITADGKAGFCCQLADNVGAETCADIVADLHHVTLAEAHRRMMDAVAAFRAEKSRRQEQGALTALDACPCWYCLKYFKKVDWMRAYPDSAWTRDLLGRGCADPGERTFRHHPDALETLLDDGEATLVHLTTTLSYTLNRTGKAIWDLLGRGLSMSAVAERLVGTFSVEPDRARADVGRFVSELEAFDLIVPVERPS